MRMMSPASMARSLSPRYIEVLAVGGEDAVDEVAAALDVAPQKSGVDVTLAVAGADGGEDLEVGVVLNVGGLFQEGDFGGGLDPADGVHEGGAVDEPGVGEEGLYLGPAGGIDVGGLHADFSLVYAHVLEHRDKLRTG